ncbi:hypothetical protein Fmac_017517 [Flemingia macrophylla]|uniref:Uncharacterized protein n=1 Tax=Flemingia macrophylla TaxID=520843 RepID=A0ABD1M2B8_9FABA
MANFKAAGVVPEDFDWYQRKKLFKDANHYVWDDPYLFKIGVDGLLRRCVASDECKDILWHCHNSPYGGHYEWRARTLQRYFKLDFSGLLFSRMLTHIAKAVINVKELVEFQEDMNYHFKISLRWRFLIVGASTLLVHCPLLIQINTFWWQWIMSLNGWKLV